MSQTRCALNSHVATRSISLANHEIAARVVVPRDIEVTSSVVSKGDIRKIVGPILDRIEAVLPLLNLRLRCCTNGGTDRKNGGCK